MLGHNLAAAGSADRAAFWCPPQYASRVWIALEVQVVKSFITAVAVAGGAIVVSLAGAGLAHAGPPADTSGQFYSKASAALKGDGYKVVVASRFGDQVPMDDCLVSRQQSNTKDKTVRLDLRCYKSEVDAVKEAQKKLQGSS